jgi:hypothetical protein
MSFWSLIRERNDEGRVDRVLDENSQNLALQETGASTQKPAFGIIYQWRTESSDRFLLGASSAELALVEADPEMHRKKLFYVSSLRRILTLWRVFSSSCFYPDAFFQNSGSPATDEMLATCICRNECVRSLPSAPYTTGTD